MSHWLILWIISDWVKTRILFWFLKAWIINLNFSNALSVLECSISFTKRKLKIRTLKRTSALLTDKKTFFSSNSAILCCLDAMNDESMFMIQLRIKLRYAIETRNFLSRSRFCFDDAKASWWTKVRIVKLITKWSFFNSMNENVFSVNDDEFSSLT